MMAAWELLIVAVCLVFGAFFSGMETGITSIHRMRLRHFVKKGRSGADILEGFLDHPDRLLGTTLVGNNICTVMTSVFSAHLAVRALGAWSEALSTVVVTMVLLIFSEYLPKTWFHARPLDRCRRFVGMLRVSELVLKPVSIAVIWLTRWLVRGPSRTFSEPAPFVTREDLKVLAREGEKDGVLSSRERSMIHRVFELAGKRAGQVMVPRSRMVNVDRTASIEVFFDTARKAQFTRMPVYDKEKNAFSGIINVFDLLSNPMIDHARPVSDFARKPLFISEAMPVDDILPKLRRARQPMGLVVNAAGEVTGLITTEDILKEIVGQL